MYNGTMKTLVILLGLMAPAVAAAQQVCNSNIPASTPTSSFVVANGTATDTHTGLMWKRCAEGQSWNGANCAGTAGSYAWQGALQRAKAVNDAGGYAGHADWRLPNIKELRSLVEEKCYNPSINATVFPATPASGFWSASAGAYDSGGAWGVSFGYGGANGYYKYVGGQVRLVRGGQSFDSFGVGACTIGGTVSGRVLDATKQQALAKITVTLGASSTTSASDGSFSFSSVAAGPKTLTAYISNFAGGGVPVTVCGDTTQDILLTTNETALGGPNSPASFSGFGGDPVNTATGNYTFARTDLKLPGKGIGFAFERGYNSLDPLNGPLGYGWTHNWNTGVAVDGAGNVTVRHGDGRTVTFAPKAGGGYTAQYGVFDTLVKEADASYTLTRKDLNVLRFGADLKLVSIADRNGNTIALTYTGGLLTRVTDAAGRNVDFTYDGSGRITQLTDALNRKALFAYDAAGNLTSSTDPAGKVTSYSYDANHQMLSATDPRANVFVSNTYDATLRVVTSQKDAKLGQTTYAYDSVTRQTTITDPLGQVSVHTHDSLLRLIREQDALGHSQIFTYDTAGNRSTVTDRNGKVTAYEYDAAGNVTMKTDALVRYTSITYGALNNPLTRTDALGKVTSFAYDAKGNLTSTTDALGKTVSSTYDGAGLPLTLTDARGNVTTNTYDAQGNLTKVSDALGKNTSLAYDAAGRRLTRTDALGRITAYAYDADDNLVSVTDPAGKATLYAYDGNNNRVSTTDKLGRITTIAYDQKDLPTTLTDALGGVSSSAYDALDRKLSTTDKRGKVTQFAYDAAGRLVKVTDALTNQTQYAYDAQGNRTAVSDALGHTASFTYDALNRLTQGADALGNTSTTVFDALGRVSSTTNAKAQTTGYSYDDVGRLIQVTDAAGGIVAYAYDAAGNRTSMSDPRGNVTSYAYDALNRLITKTEPGGYVTQIAYDVVGNRSQITKPDGSIVQYAYDALDRLTGVTYPDASQVTFTYDASGKRKTMVDALGSTTYSYDALDRLTSLVNPFGKTVGYAYDAAGNLTALTYPDAKQVTYAYDALNRLSSLTDWASRSTSYTYDAAGRLTGSTLANGAQATYAYDNADRLTALAHQANAQTFASYAYTLDAIGNQTQVSGTEPIQPVIAAASNSYTYDADNRLTQINATTQSFDPNGNLTAKGSDGFTWDFEDRLLQSTVAGNTNSYQYDGTGNRLSRTAAGSTTRFVLDVNGALSRVLGETDNAGAISAWYVHGLGLVERVGADGSVRFYHHDSRGSTVALSDGAGAVTDKYAYDPFGQVANSAGSTPNPFRYVGRFGLFDEANGLIYIRARYYDPGQGRFLSKDPKPGNDADGQSLHRFVYAMNNPVGLIDPLGLYSWSVAGTGLLQITAGVGKLASMVLTGSETVLSFVATSNPALLGVGVASMMEDLNDASKQFSASVNNIAINASYERPETYAEEIAGLFDKTFYKIPTVKSSIETLSIFDAVRGFAGAVNNSDKLSKLSNAERLKIAKTLLASGVDLSKLGSMAPDMLSWLDDLWSNFGHAQAKPLKK